MANAKLFKRLAVVILVFVILLCAFIHTSEMNFHDRRVGSSHSQTKDSDMWQDVDQQATSPRSPLLVNVVGDFSHRVARFNAFLNALRIKRFVGELKKPWVRPQSNVTVVNGSRDDYVTQLHVHENVTTVALPWLKTDSSDGPWNSLRDKSNLLLQSYHEWTADDQLCTWIETIGTIKMRYDSIFNRTCVRNINETTKPISLKPTFLNGKPLFPPKYWPNNGDSYPAHFYTDHPPFVSHVHIFRDGIVNDLGDVYSGDVKLMLYGCSYDTNPSLPLGGEEDNVPFYEEVFVLSQQWGTALFHRMAEVAPRLAFVLDFLKANPQIRIVASEGPGSRLGEILQVMGLDRTRLVTGITRAKVVYQPRVTGCGFANVQESQIINAVYRDYIRRHLGPPSPRNSLVLIRRSGARSFTEQAAIEKLVSQAASDYNLTFTMFIDNPTPSFEETMKIFHSAIAVVAPHGAGLSNIYFSEPGTYVVEGVCNLPHVNFCFQRLAHILGHHWHGVPSRGGCEGVVDVAAASIDRALRSHLRQWAAERLAEENRQNVFRTE